MPSPFTSLVYACLALAVPVSAASAAVIVEHAGSTNPASTSWTVSGGGGAGMSTGGEAGPPASWRVTDGSASQSLGYVVAITPEVRDEATANGWKLSAQVRLNDVDDDGDDAGAAVEYATSGGQWYRLLFGTNASGEVTVRVQRHGTIGNASNVSYTLAGSSTSQFNLFELVYNPGTNSADLFVNGDSNPVLSNIPPGALSQNRVIFGSLSGGGLGDANYALVRFETVPEPASMAMLAAGGLLLGVRPRPAAQQ